MKYINRKTRMSSNDVGSNNEMRCIINVFETTYTAIKL